MYVVAAAAVGQSYVVINRRVVAVIGGEKKQFPRYMDDKSQMQELSEVSILLGTGFFWSIPFKGIE